MLLLALTTVLVLGTPIDELNAFEDSKPFAAPKAVFGKNHFSSLKPEEWRARFPSQIHYHGESTLGYPREVTYTDAEIAVALSHSVDWRSSFANPGNVTAVTRIRNQGQCGACWSFAVIAALEGAWAASGQPLSAFSEQWILDCLPPTPYFEGCGGGAINALVVALQSPMPTVPYAKNYEFSSWNNHTTGVCQLSNGGVAQVSRGLQVEATSSQNIEDAFAAFLYYSGPLAVGVAASSSRWMSYQSGILTCPETNLQLDHAVTLVGYGTDSSGNKYWIAKNSWSPGWGENGYLKLARGTNECLVGSVGVSVEVVAP